MLVTGASRGIGRFLAGYYLQRGFLVEGCSRGEPDLEQEGYAHHRVDVTNEEQVAGMLAAIQDRHGRLDVAVNNAGAASMNHLLLTPGSSVDRIMSLNLKGTFLVSRESAKLMKRRGYGRIVNLGSVAVPLALEGEAVYAASKGAVVTLTRVMARELGGFGITCNVVGPTPIDTDLTRGVPRDKIDRIVQGLAVKRQGMFEDVANVVDFFISPRSGYITGQVIYLGGV
ncbi:MAG: SDR family NAD(P)-dependent oxidoreductase [Spirochaetota bacterium]